MNKFVKIAVLLLFTLVFVQFADAQTYTQNEQDCFNLVQGKVAYDKLGNKQWHEPNVRDLCRGTTNPVRTVDCFNLKIINYNDWQRGIRECAPAVLDPKPFPTPQPNPTPGPNPIPPGGEQTATDIDVGKNGDVWIIGTNPVPGGFGIFKRTGSSWTQVGGGAVRIAVGDDGDPWVVNDTGTIYHRANGSWVEIPGAKARDIDIADHRTLDKVWIVDDRGDVRIWSGGARAQWIPVGENANAERLAVDLAGTPWIRTGRTTLKWFRRQQWRVFNNLVAATTIATGGNDSIWILNSRNQPAELVRTTFRERTQLAPIKEIAMDMNSTLWMIDQNGRISNIPGNNPAPQGNIDQAQECMKMVKRRMDYTPTLESLVEEDSAWRSQNIPILCRESKSYTDTVFCFDLNTNLYDRDQAIRKCSAKPEILPNARTIRFKNEAGYVAKMVILYFVLDANGAPVPKNLITDKLAYGQSQLLDIPLNTAPNTKVTVSLMGTATVKENFYSTSLNANFSGDLCFKAWGTLFSPQGGGCQ